MDAQLLQLTAPPALCARSLQNDLKDEKMKRDEASRERDLLQVRGAAFVVDQGRAR